MSPTAPRLARGPAAAALGAAVALAFAAPAQGHAIVSPAVVQSATSYVYTLSVPTEREGYQTSAVTLTVPRGFAIDAFAPAPGWKRRAASTGSGENAVVTRVTWSGGHTPTGEAAVFQFNASASSEQTYAFEVRQTYNDASIVDWSGDESSDTPAPRVEAKATLGGGGSSTVSVVALLAGTLGVLLGLAALLAGRGERPVT
jgi:uncharacterized protein YcnI